MYPTLSRLSMIFIGYFEDENFFLSVIYSRTLINIFFDFTVWSSIVAITSEVGKMIGNKNYEKIPKILASALIFNIFYTLIVLLPICIWGGYILYYLTGISWELAIMINKVNLTSFVFCLMESINYTLIGYFQSLGLGFSLGRYNFFIVIFSFISSIIIYIFTQDGYWLYFSYYYILFFIQLGVLIYYYLDALMPISQIKSFLPELDILKIMAKKMMGNSIYEFLEFFPYEIIMIFSAKILSIKENVGFLFIYNLLFCYINITYSIKNLPYLILFIYIGAKNKLRARKWFSHANVLIWVISFIFWIFFYAFFYILKNSFENLKEISQCYHLFFILYIILANSQELYLSDVLKGIDKRIEGGSLSFLNIILCFVLCWSLESFKGIGLILACTLSKFTYIILATIYLEFIHDWNDTIENEDLFK